MSMPFNIISCQNCDEQWDSTKLWGSFNYLLGTGEKIPLNRTLGWCHHCNTFQSVEVLPEVSKIENELTEFKEEAE